MRGLSLSRRAFQEHSGNSCGIRAAVIQFEARALEGRLAHGVKTDLTGQ
jgi:hypothetical protein